jgi:predicted transcriptional regulator
MSQDFLALTADIVSAHVGNNTVAPSELPTLISSVHQALAATEQPVEPDTPKQEPAVSVRASVKPEYLVSLESGRKVKMLKRYLMTNYSMTPDDYRRKWDLPKDYPMVAPAYAEKRRDLAMSYGLGRKRQTAVAGEVNVASESVAKVTDAVTPKKVRRPGSKTPAKSKRARNPKAADAVKPAAS